MREIPTPEKKDTVAALRAAATEAQNIYLTEFSGLSVAEANELRGRVLESGARLRVVKNRLFKLALQGTDLEPLIEYLTGPNAATFCGEDALAPVKVLTEFAEAHGQAPVKAGFVDGKLISREEAQQLAKLPGRQQLLAEVVGAFAGPVSELVFTLGGIVSELVYTLQAVADQRDEQAA